MYVAKGAHDAALGCTSKLELDLKIVKRAHAEYSEPAPIGYRGKRRPEKRKIRAE